MRRRQLLAGAAGLAVTASLSAACSGGDGSASGGHKLTVGLTYTPNIQFAAYYVAEKKGYYDDAGLNVTLRHHGAAESLFGALSGHKEDLVEAGGDEMLQARSQGTPIVTIATFFQTYPVALLVPEDSSIRRAGDLRGKSVGIPGPYGETYFGLLALLREAGLSTKDVSVRNIGFTQQAALAAGHVDSVMGYVNNDAVALDRSGHPVRSIVVGSAGSVPLVGVGLGALSSTLRKRPADVRAFVAATLRGQQYVVDHPDDTVEVSKSFIPGLSSSKQRDDARAILQATIPLWSAGGHPAGYNNSATWRRMAVFMSDTGLLKKHLGADGAFTNAYLPPPQAR